MKIRGNDLLLQEIDGEVVILDSLNGKLHKLNSVARHVWQGVAEGDNFDSIVDAICISFSDCERTQVEQDVGQCVQQLLELGLVLP